MGAYCVPSQSQLHTCGALQRVRGDDDSGLGGAQYPHGGKDMSVWLWLGCQWAFPPQNFVLEQTACRFQCFALLSVFCQLLGERNPMRIWLLVCHVICFTSQFTTSHDHTPSSSSSPSSCRAFLTGIVANGTKMIKYADKRAYIPLFLSIFCPFFFNSLTMQIIRLIKIIGHSLSFYFMCMMLMI